MIEDRLYTIAETCAVLRVSRWTVLRRIREGEVSGGRHGVWPTVRLSRRCTRIPGRALSVFLARAGQST